MIIRPGRTCAMAFPDTLEGLEKGVAFFNYYRSFVPRLSVIAEPLHRLKTLRLRPGPKKGGARRKYVANTSVDNGQPDDTT